MNNNIIRRVIVLGAISILSLLTVQTYWVLRTWDIQEREFNRKVNQAMLDAVIDLGKINGFTPPPDNFVRQLSSNYWVVNIENPFQADDLEYYLAKEFQQQNLKEDYKYAIFDCTSDQMVRGKLIKYTASEEPLAEPLQKHYDSNFIYYFGVEFPGKTTNILTNMWIVIFFTILMLITVAFFVYTMIVILRQKQLSELQRDFINNMTHEFKTPISTINISTDVFLQNEKVQGDQRLHRYSGIIKEQVLRLNTQVEKVLQLAKIERDNIELHVEDVNLAELVTSISPSIEIKVNDKKGILHLDLNAANPWVRADRLHLTNILHNLVDNAVKYSKQTPEIHIRLFNESNNLALSVQDNGIGIPKEHQKRVFDKFYRVPTGNVHNVKGFGLGLFYVKTMCQEHKWKLDLYSEVNKGTTITIRMPQSK
ncbi:MAG TPA: HAMP domain-containing sensor histidine kinase [Saprospiraceae bacterium]|nr:HAMP domain-containing sensor histidine kinase [Saprospiraceae bacterium]HPI05898.1 HAMP domain-containing sensor histidine kinase [Saprospiraceae bacterium]